MFPPPRYWKQNFDEIPQYASKYVEDYLGTTIIALSKIRMRHIFPSEQKPVEYRLRRIRFTLNAKQSFYYYISLQCKLCIHFKC